MKGVGCIDKTTSFLRKVSEEMAPTGHSNDRIGEVQKDARHMLNYDLREIDERLRVLVEACQEMPSAIDNYILDSAMNFETTIVDAYRIMKASVYAEDSPLRASSDVWEAFIEQKDEFLAFYVSALKALEVYKEVLLAYNRFRGMSKSSPEKGDLERIRQDKRTHVDERQECISAVSDFQGKFSAMLVALIGGPVVR